MELEIFEVPRSSKYVDGIKYGLICHDIKTGRRVLFDNHHPKGPHIHLDEQEMDYEFKDEDILMEDFKNLVWSHLGVKL